MCSHSSGQNVERMHSQRTITIDETKKQLCDSDWDLHYIPLFFKQSSQSCHQLRLVNLRAEDKHNSACLSGHQAVPWGGSV